MGKTIDEGVVDGQLRVHGVRNLRVIDASIDPVIPDCRPQQVVYMTAEMVRLLFVIHLFALLTQTCRDLT